jgi:CelD/BcsL family acetyltransferase involved in cellulose biosynthesis
VAPLSTEVIEDEAGLDAIRGSWDELAVAARQPYSCPAWMVAWWRHARPKRARLRAIAAFDGDQLAGIAPLYLAPGVLGRREQRLLAARLASPAGPLALPGRETEVAAALAPAIAPGGATVRLEGQARAPDWPHELAQAWPGRSPWVHSALPTPAPCVTLDGLDYESWLAGKSSSFRKEARKDRRRLEAAGGSFTLAGPETAERMLSAFLRLHEARWSTRGGSNALVPGLPAMLSEVARELVPSGRMRLYAIEAGGEPVCVLLQVAAGGQVNSWNVGFDEQWGEYSPGSQLILYGIGDAMERGDRRLDLGPGAQPYKVRLADSQTEVDTITLVARGAGYPVDRARLAHYQARWALSRRLSPETKQRLKRLVRR